MVSIINARLYDFESYESNGFVSFDSKTGVILNVGPMSEFEVQGETIDAGGKLLLPGLINFHTHVYSAFARGFNFKAMPQNFGEVLSQVWWPLDRAIDKETLYWSAIAYGKESLRHGVVGLIDHHASGEIIGTTGTVEKALEALGMHGISSFEISDRFNVDQAIAENLSAKVRSRALIGLHASMTLSDQTLRRLFQTIDGHPIHIHVSEGLEDHGAFEQTPIARLESFGLVTKDSLMVHGVHMSEEDALRIKAKGAVLAINPRSNLNNAVGTANFSMILKAGIPFVAGTDGLGSNVAASWQDIYFQSINHSGSPSGVALEAIRRSIANGYGYYERITGKRLGRFLKGYRMDAMLLAYEAFTPMHAENAFAHVFYGAFDTLDIEWLWIGGKAILRDQKWVNEIPVDPIWAERLWCRIGGENEIEG